MIQRLGIAFAASVVCAAALAQAPASARASKPPAAERAMSSHLEMQARTGTLKKFRAGKSVVIAGSDGRVRTFALDPAARVDRDLARGQRVNVISLTDGTGQERVRAISRSVEAGSGADPAASPKPAAPER